MKKLLTLILLLALIIPIVSAEVDFTAFSQPNLGLCAGSAAYTNITIINNAALQTTFFLSQSGEAANFTGLYPYVFVLEPGAQVNVYELFNTTNYLPGYYELTTHIQTTTGLYKVLPQKIYLGPCNATIIPANVTGFSPYVKASIKLFISLIVLVLVFALLFSIKPVREAYDWEKYLEKKEAVNYNKFYGLLVIIALIVIAWLIKLKVAVVSKAFDKIKSMVLIILSYKYYIIAGIIILIILGLILFFVRKKLRIKKVEKPRRVERRAERRPAKKIEMPKISLPTKFGKIIIILILLFTIIGLILYFWDFVVAAIIFLVNKLKLPALPNLSNVLTWLKEFFLNYIADYIVYIVIGLIILIILVLILERRKSK